MKTTKRALRTTTLALALLAAGCEGPQGSAGTPGAPGAPGTPGAPGAPGNSATVDPALAPVDKAFAGIGGKAAIQGLESFTLEVSGNRYLAGEGYVPEAEAVHGSAYETTVTYDVKGDRIRLDTQRTIKSIAPGLRQSYKIFIRGNLGYVEGIESAFNQPTGNMLSDRWAAERKQLRLLNPHLILRDIAATPAIAKPAGEALLDGSIHQLVVVEDAVAPITLYVNAQTGRISKLSTWESDPVVRDVLVEVHYLGWRSVAGGPLFPSQVFLSHNGHLLHTETRKTLTANVAPAATLFDFPSAAAPEYKAADAARGALSHQFHMGFAGFGVPLDGLQTFVDPVVLAPGVTHLRGGSHNSLLVEQANGLVLVEAPLNQERSEALLAWAKGAFATKPVTHVLASHFHDDHSAGLRTFVPENVTVVVGEPSARFFRRVFEAPSTLKADALSRKPTAAKLQSVAVDGSLSVEDATQPVRAYHVKTGHAADMLMFYVPSAKLVFVADIYSPGLPPFPFFAAELYRSITETHKLDVERIAGAHGAVGTLADLKTAAGL